MKKARTVIKKNRKDDSVVSTTSDRKRTRENIKEKVKR